MDLSFGEILEEVALLVHLTSIFRGDLREKQGSKVYMNHHLRRRLAGLEESDIVVYVVKNDIIQENVLMSLPRAEQREDDLMRRLDWKIKWLLKMKLKWKPK